MALKSVLRLVNEAPRSDIDHTDRKVALQEPSIIELHDRDRLTRTSGASALSISLVGYLCASAEGGVVIECAVRLLQVDHLPRTKNEENHECGEDE